jgi:hypothetical protein
MNVTSTGRRFQAVVSAVALLTLSTAAESANLLVNSNFDNPPGDLGGWSATGQFATPPPVWDGTQECCGTPASGSAKTSAFVIAASFLGQCIAVLPNTLYDLAAHVIANNTSITPTGARATMQLDSFVSTDCTGTSVQTQSTFVNQAAAWIQIGLPNFDSGPGAQSVRVQFSASSGGLSTGIVANWDNAAFGPSGTVPVKLQSFYVE